jgi:DNA-binding NarL/FixJ family response regulator
MLTVSGEARHNSTGDGPLRGATRRDLRLLAVDDHPAVRMGLQRLLEDEPGFEVVAVCPTGEGAVSRAEHEGVDVAVVDYHLGGRNGLWVSRKLKRLPRPPRVVIFSAFANDHLAANCVVAGADALLSKGSLGSELCDTVRSVARGRRMLPRVARPMADMLRGRLHGAEQPIFGMLLAGMSRAEIEQTLGMSDGEFEAREAAMLVKLEPLPGERLDPAARVDPDRRLPLQSSPRSRRSPFPAWPPHCKTPRGKPDGAGHRESRHAAARRHRPSRRTGRSEQPRSRRARRFCALCTGNGRTPEPRMRSVPHPEQADGVRA